MKLFAFAAAALACVCNAHAALFSFHFTDGTNAGHGTLITDASDFATGGSMTVTSGVDAGTYTLFANASEPNAVLSPSGAFAFDDKVYAGNTPAMNGSGLLFMSGGTEINLWGNSGHDDYSFWSHDASGYNVSSNSVTFDLQAVPEPASLACLSLGALALIRRRKTA